jgi:hypothetical protein
MAFEASEDYKQRLSDWVGQQTVDLSYRRLSIRIALQIDDEKGIGHDTLRKWHLKELKERLSDEMVAKIALYRGMTDREVENWLDGNQRDGTPPMAITIKQVQAIESLEEIGRIMSWLVEQQRQLMTSVVNPDPPPKPQTLEEFHHYLRHNTEQVAARSELTPNRIMAIADGADPTALEIGLLAKAFDGKADWIKQLYSPAKIQSPPKTETHHPAKTQRAKPLGGKA